MSKRILIANIGNRNLVVSKDHEKWMDIEKFIEKEPLKDYFFFNKTLNREVSNLKAFTKDLMENKFILHYKLNILTEDLIYTEKPDAILLFSTLQSIGDHQYQDTFYCGELIKQKLENKIGKPIYNNIIDANPSSEEAIFPLYAQYFRTLKNDFPEDLEFIFLDAGGTTQMKAVIKTLLEFYFKAQAKIIYQSISKIQSELPVRDYHKHYAFLSLTEKFIHSFNYEAAHKVVSNLSLDSEGKLTSLLKHLDICRKRLGFEHQSARSLYVHDKTLNKLFESYIKNEPLTNASILSEFNKRAQHDIQEIASIVDLFLQQKNYTLCIATYYRLVEEIGQSYIEVKYKMDFSKIDKQRRWNIATDLKNEIGNSFPSLKEDWNVPLLIASMLLNDNMSNTQKLAEIIVPSISNINGQNTGLNTLRNQCYLAHCNQAITKGIISSTCKNFLGNNGLWANLKSALELPERNIYIQMNEVVCKLLFEQ